MSGRLEHKPAESGSEVLYDVNNLASKVDNIMSSPIGLRPVNSALGSWRNEKKEAYNDKADLEHSYIYLMANFERLRRVCIKRNTQKTDDIAKRAQNRMREAESRLDNWLRDPSYENYRKINIAKIDEFSLWMAEKDNSLSNFMPTAIDVVHGVSGAARSTIGLGGKALSGVRSLLRQVKRDEIQA